MKNDHCSLVSELLKRVSHDDILDFCTVINESKVVYVMGNGGSASTAEHFTVDLIKACKKPAVALSANTAVLTAYANDNGYNRAYVDQLTQYNHDDSCLFCISTSGNSPNVVEAAKWAWVNNVPVLSLVSFEGGKLLDFSDYAIHVETDVIEAAEDVHSALCHAMVRELKRG